MASNHDKKPAPRKRAAPRAGSAGADALARQGAEESEQRRTEVIPSPVPYDGNELGSGRGFTYEWEFWINRVQQQIDTINASGGGGGGGSGSVTYVHTQSSAAAVWTITHSLGTKPNVLVVDSSGQELLTEVNFLSNSQVTVTHALPYAGTAYLRA